MLSMRSKSRGPGHRQGEGAAGNEYQGVRIFGTISEVAYFSVLPLVPQPEGEEVPV